DLFCDFRSAWDTRSADAQVEWDRPTASTWCTTGGLRHRIARPGQVRVVGRHVGFLPGADVERQRWHLLHSTRSANDRATRVLMAGAGLLRRVPARRPSDWRERIQRHVEGQLLWT